MIRKTFQGMLCILLSIVILIGCAKPTELVTLPPPIETIVPLENTPTQTKTASPIPTHTSIPSPTATPTSTPVPLAATAIAAGVNHTCAVTNHGGVMCWGNNENGQLGDGTTTTRLTPVEVTGLTSGVVAVDVSREMLGWSIYSDSYSCILLTNGGVKCWGNNSGGQLGDGTTEQRLTPVDVVGLTSGVMAISTGWSHTCAVTTHGGVMCWGSNWSGQLGVGTMPNRLTPVHVEGLTSGIKTIQAGASHTCALTNSGGVKCWGENGDGQLGDGTTKQQLTPVDVVGLTSDIEAISTGTRHTCALTTRGGVKCWGFNAWGQLGDGTTDQRLAPVDVVGLTSGVTAIAVGASHTCALTTSGGVMCWGENSSGKLGDGTIEQRTTPVQVEGLTSGSIFIASGASHTCALTTGGGIKCWGANAEGQLGDGSGEAWLTPGEVIGLTGGVTAVEAGESWTCALTTEGGERCWGMDRHVDNVTPMDLEGFTSGVSSFSMLVWDGLTCLLSTDSGVICWDFYPQYHDHIDILASDVTTLSVGTKHACALVKGGGVKCWGVNAEGQLGDGTTIDRQSPVDVMGLTSGVAAISVGGMHTCALLTNGGVKCWGHNGSGELGDETTIDRLTPVDVVGLTSGVSAISAGFYHTCVLLTNGGVKCWGSNWDGRLGDGTTATRLIPVDVVGLTSGVAAVNAGGGFLRGHTCALMIDGSVKCWGNNTYGQLGDGTTEQCLTPVDVVGLSSGVTAIAVGAYHTCALTTSGGVVCWGSNLHGTLGRGTSAFQTTPVDVVGFEP